MQKTLTTKHTNYTKRGNMKSPKIVVIGAGSYFFARPVIWNMVNSRILREGTLALVDTKPHVLETMMKLGRKAIAATKAPVKLVGSTDRREMLKDADFVVLTFSDKNAYYRGVDCRISEKYGVRMCSGDTIGPGGIFRALREVPRAIEMSKDIAKLAPEAWTINFVNPTSVLGIALMRYAPQIRSFAICDGLHEPYHRVRMLKHVGILPEDATSIPPEIERSLEYHVQGVNHFTWLAKFAYKGKDFLPVWREKLKEMVKNEVDDNVHNANAKAKAKFNAAYSLLLMDIFGAYPNCMAHTKEYVPYFQGYGVNEPYPEKLMVFDAQGRDLEMKARWKENEEFASGKRSIKEFLTKGKGDHATDIIESMWGGLRKKFYINSANRGAVPNMANDAFIELLCDLDMNGPRPLPASPMPRGLLGLQQQVLDTHELTAEAAVTCDRGILMRAMMTDPIINNIEDGRKIMKELLDEERDILPKKWYK